MALIALLCASVAVAQAPRPPAAQLHTQTTVVLVPALVSTGDGKPVFTLTADDFKITDDGAEQRLTLDEDTGGEPLALVVAVETGGGGARKLASYGNLSALLGAVVGAVPHRIAVVGFDGSPELVEDFTADVDAAGAAIHDLQPGDKGAAILDALKFSVDLLRKEPATWRRAILLISETNDHGSQAGMDEALRAVSDTNTAIYSLGFSSGKSEAGHYGSRELPFSKSDGGIKLENARSNPPHGCMGDDPTDPDEAQNKAVRAYDCLTQLAPPLALAKMAAIAASDGLKQNVPETVARVTGGEYFKFENARGLVNGLVTISNHVPNRYVLSFHPESPHTGFHAVELKLRDRPGLRIAARSGYWVDSDSTAAAPAQP
jgi:VWFA-related protein